MREKRKRQITKEFEYMNLYMKQRIFSWRDRFSIYDENGNDRYYVEGELFSWGKKLHLYDMGGNELAYISQKLFSFLPKYTVYRQGIEVCVVTKEFTFFKHEFSVDGLGWGVFGDFFDHEYEISNGSKVIANVSKQWFTLGDSYRLCVTPDIDEITALCVVLAVDAAIEEQSR